MKLLINNESLASLRTTRSSIENYELTDKVIKKMLAMHNSEGGSFIVGNTDAHSLDYCSTIEGEDVNDFNFNPIAFQQKLKCRMDQTADGNGNMCYSYKVSDPEEKALPYCTIMVEKGIKPLFFNGNELYIQIGRETNQLYGVDMISYLKNNY